MENIKKYLDKITRELLDKENNKTELSEDSINWVTEITSPLYKLIDNIIKQLKDGYIKHKKELIERDFNDYQRCSKSN